MGTIRRELIQEFGTGKEAREKRSEFVKANGGFKGLRKIRTLEGAGGLNKKISSFKSGNQGRPGQKPDSQPDSPKNPGVKDGTKPEADKEWDKKSDEKSTKELSKLKEDPKQYKKFEADNQTDAIKEVNDAKNNKDIAKLRGIVDKALAGQKSSPQEKLAALGLAKKEDLVLSGNANEKGEFGLYRAKDPKNAFAKITINEKGEFKYESLDSKNAYLVKQKELSKMLSDIRENPDLFQGFEAKSKEDGITQFQDAFKQNNITL